MMRRAVLAVVLARIALACTDGVTPDCSDPAVCAPIYGDAATPLDANDAASASDVTTSDSSDAADADGG